VREAIGDDGFERPDEIARECVAYMDSSRFASGLFMPVVRATARLLRDGFAALEASFYKQELPIERITAVHHGFTITDSPD
jgi:hypothetical protein